MQCSAAPSLTHLVMPRFLPGPVKRRIPFFPCLCLARAYPISRYLTLARVPCRFRAGSRANRFLPAGDLPKVGFLAYDFSFHTDF